VVMDMAPTVAAFGKVRMKAALASRCRSGWMIDREGKPLTDAARAAEGHLLPIGDYKGYALSLIIGLLAGPLNRAAFGREIVDFLKNPSTATNTGQSVLAVSVERSAPPTYSRRTWMWRCARSGNPSGCPASSASGCRASRATQSGSTASPTHPDPADAAQESRRAGAGIGDRAAALTAARRPLWPDLRSFKARREQSAGPGNGAPRPRRRHRTHPLPGD